MLLLDGVPRSAHHGAGVASARSVAQPPISAHAVRHFGIVVALQEALCACARVEDCFARLYSQSARPPEACPARVSPLSAQRRRSHVPRHPPPLSSCTMKRQPRGNEVRVRFPWGAGVWAAGARQCSEAGSRQAEKALPPHGRGARQARGVARERHVCELRRCGMPARREARRRRSGASAFEVCDARFATAHEGSCARAGAMVI